MNSFQDKKPGDPITVFINGERYEGIVRKVEKKVLKILNPRGVVIDVPVAGEIELGE